MLMAILFIFAFGLLLLSILDVEEGKRWHFIFIIPLALLGIGFYPFLIIALLWYIMLARKKEKD